MFAVLSPAKKLDYSPVATTRSDELRWTKPLLLDDTKELMEVTRTLKSVELQKLMKLSVSLGDLNYQRFQDFSVSSPKKNAKPAVLAFNGDTYQGLDASSLSNEELRVAQSQIGILSGLYGLLRPLDLMQPYRLEMGTRLKNPRGSNLYKFWGTRIAEEINKQLRSLKTNTLVNLASTEYFKAVPLEAIEGSVITPVFKEIKNGAPPKVIGFFAKRARGMMARYIVQKGLRDPNQLKDFRVAEYEFSPKLSDELNWVFVRERNEN